MYLERDKCFFLSGGDRVFMTMTGSDVDDENKKSHCQWKVGFCAKRILR